MKKNIELKMEDRHLIFLDKLKRSKDFDNAVPKLVKKFPELEKHKEKASEILAEYLTGRNGYRRAMLMIGDTDIKEQLKHYTFAIYYGDDKNKFPFRGAFVGILRKRGWG